MIYGRFAYDSLSQRFIRSSKNDDGGIHMCIRLFLVRAERTRYINVKHWFRFVSERNKSEREVGKKSENQTTGHPVHLG